MTEPVNTPKKLEIPVSDYDYDLPKELIAQEPVEPRDASRLLVVKRSSDSLEDRRFHELPELLQPGDLLVLNDTRVRHARLLGRRRTGGKVELLVLHPEESDVWQCLARPARRLRPGEQIELLDRQQAPTGHFVTLETRDAGTVRLTGLDEGVIEDHGSVPLPPYIRQRLDDPDRYQTVYRNESGSAAAPTAGLHFTPELLDRCEEKGILIARLTLHVGLDTFRPVTADDALDHEIHSEWCRVPGETVRRISETRTRGSRVVAVGTTVVRALETAARSGLPDAGYSGWTDLYIVPPFDFQVVDALITNFHLPRSTLLLLVSAFAGKTRMWNAYEHAIRSRYRFYSFGDAMLIL